MSTFAPLQSDVTADITAETESEMEALIKEARRRTRRRRTALAVVAAATVLALAAAFAVLASNPGEQAASPARGAAQANEVASAAAGPAETDLVAALWVHHMSSSWGDLWLYLYADGRLIRFASGGWQQQRLTREGVGMVRDMMLDAGIFDAAPQARSPEDKECCGLIQMRLDGELVSVPHSWIANAQGVEEGERPEKYRVTPSFDLVMARLATLAKWLPRDAWAEADVVDYRPTSYIACGWQENGAVDLRRLSALGGFPGLRPASAAVILRDAAPVAAIPAEADHWYKEWMLLGRDECLLLPAGPARALEAVLDGPAWEGSGGWFETVWEGKELNVGLHPVLPHGVPGIIAG